MQGIIGYISDTISKNDKKLLTIFNPLINPLISRCEKYKLLPKALPCSSL